MYTYYSNYVHVRMLECFCTIQYIEVATTKHHLALGAGSKCSKQADKLPPTDLYVNRMNKTTLF